MATKKRLLSPTGLDGNSQTLTNVATPSASSDASTKGYVDTLVPSQTGNTGKYLTTNGTATSWGTIAGGGSVTSITAGTGLSGGVITTSGTIAIDSTVATLTGTQTLTNKTLTSPTFTAPVLGTPASGTLTNCTFPTLNQNTTGSAGSVANTLTISSPLSGTSYNGSSAVSIGIPVATTSVSGYLSSTDWTTFNNKTSNTGTVTSVSGAGTVSGLTLTGTVTGSGSLTLGGTIATLNQNTTGSAGSVPASGLTGSTLASNVTASSLTSVGTLTGLTVTTNPSYFRKNQTDGSYTTAAIWTESYGTTTTGIAFHISGVAGKFLEMRTNGTLYFDNFVMLNSGNYNSYAPTLTGTGASGTWGISITGSAGSVPASGLTGATLASGVTASSLTSVGTLGSLTVSGRISVGDSVAQIYQDGSRLKVRSESTDDVVHFASYGMYLPKVSQTYNLYLAEGLQIGYGTASPYLSYRTGDLIFRSDATERMRLTAGGSLGIGTSSPSQKLSVSNNIILGTAVSGSGTPSYIDTGINYSNGATRDKCKIYLYNSGTEQYGFSVGSSADVQYHSNGIHDFYIANSLALRINSSGNVGIGATPSAWYNTFKALQIAGNGSALFGRSENNDCGLVSNGYVNTSGNWTYTASGYAGLYEILNGQHYWATAPSSTGAISFTNRMTLDNSGVLTVSSHIYASNGYMFAIHFNQSSSNSENPTIAGIWANNSGDNYCRKSTPAHFKSQMGMYHNNGSSTSNIITISSSTATGGSDGDVWLKY